MSKIIIDVPVIAYKTWCLISGHMVNGQFVEDDDDIGLVDLKKFYPYNKDNDHIM